MNRPCRYCQANHKEWATAEMCEFAHRDHPAVYRLATALARMVEKQVPTDEQIGWFLEDAEAVVDNFQPVPEKWRVRRLPDSEEFVLRFRINDVTYVIPDGEGNVVAERLSDYRGVRA